MAFPGIRRYTRLDTKLELSPVTAGAGKKKLSLSSWMRFDSGGFCEILELDKNSLVRRVGIPPRDVRMLGPIFAQSSSILARERAIVVNLEFIRAIITAEEVLILYSSNKQVRAFSDELRSQLTIKDSPVSHEAAEASAEAPPEQLPFEFKVLEIALEVVCSYRDAKVVGLERNGYLALEELTKSVNTKKLEQVRIVKHDLTRLTARVQKVREELEQLLDNDKDMADLYLTRKLILWQNINSPQLVETACPELVGRQHQADPYRFAWSASAKSAVTATTVIGENNVDELEMLLEVYFTQTDRNLNKLAMLREYIHDTENYINIQLDNKRNELMQLDLIVATVTLFITFSTAALSACSMNLPAVMTRSEVWFSLVTVGSLVISTLVCIFVLVYARWKKLLGA